MAAEKREIDERLRAQLGSAHLTDVECRQSALTARRAVTVRVGWEQSSALAGNLRASEAGGVRHWSKPGIYAIRTNSLPNIS